MLHAKIYFPVLSRMFKKENKRNRHNILGNRKILLENNAKSMDKKDVEYILITLADNLANYIRIKSLPPTTHPLPA